MKVITLRWLKAGGACQSQLDIFKETFGLKAEVNEENMLKAMEAGLSVIYIGDWLTGSYEGYQELDRFYDDLRWRVCMPHSSIIWFDSLYFALPKDKENTEAIKIANEFNNALADKLVEFYLNAPVSRTPLGRF